MAKLIITSLLFVLIVCEEADIPNHYHSITDTDFWLNLLYALLLCTLAGFCSGNTVGLLSIETLELQINKVNGTDQEKKQAELIMAVLENHHLLLSTLLLSNAFAMQTLPIVIHSLVPAWLAIVISTVIVLIVGQIVPQALCTGPRKLQIAEKSVPFVKILTKLLWIICYPLGKLLDHVIGEHTVSRIERKDLKALLKMQDSKALNSSETSLLTSVLNLREKRVKQVMVPIRKTFSLNINQRIDTKLVEQIKEKNYSFIPIYKDSPTNIVGILKTKQFAQYSITGNGKRISDFVQEDDSLLTVYEDTNLLQILMLFELKKERVALVAQGLRKTELQSIYYSKSDMIYDSKKEITVLGIVLLNTIFDELVANQNESSVEKREDKKTEMQGLREPLLH